MMNWKNVKLIFQRELRDQLRDRRTLFMIAVLPLLLYPLIGVAFMQISQFLQKSTARVQIVLTEPMIQRPALLDGAELADPFRPQAERLEIDVRQLSPSELEGLAQLAPEARQSRYDQLSREALDGQYDAVVVFPLGFTDQLMQLRTSEPLTSETPPRSAGDSNAQDDVASNDVPPTPQTDASADLQRQALVYYDAAKDRSVSAYNKIMSVLNDWRDQVVETILRERHLPVHTATPFELASQDIAPPEGKLAALWSKVLPFVVLVWAMTGAFYPAVDLCAGEKERGTLETLLSGPAERIDIVWGKLLTIMVFSVCTAILNLVCLVATASLIFRQLQHLAPDGSSAVLGPPPLASLGWLLCGLVPMAALFSALSLAFATMARSTKEGQYYLMPLFLVSMPLLLLAILPSSQLDLGTSLIPLTGVVLLLRYLIEGQYGEAFLYLVPVVLVTAGCCWAAIRWAVDQFNDETVLFRESERFNPSVWLAHLMRERGPTPSVAEALLCGVLILVIRYFASISMSAPGSWGEFVTMVVVTLVAVIATPALLMTVMLTTSPRQTLSLNMPSIQSLAAAGLLAVVVHPLALGMSVLIRKLYPFHVNLEEIFQPFGSAPNLGYLLLLVAVLPAICEELAFRGFILSGLRHMGSKWRALAISSVLFGVAHGVIQQSLLATFIGMFLGYVAIQSGSIFPCMLFHAIYNGLTVLSMEWIPRVIDRYPNTAPLFQQVHDPAFGSITMYVYRWPVILVAALLAYAILLWFRSLPFKPSAEERLHDALDRQMALRSEV